MAKRPAWTITDNNVVHKEFEFEWNGGFAISQKQKNIANLHEAIHRITGENALEISSKGKVPLGKDLSAFSLHYDGIALENIFQSAKKYEFGGPYTDLLSVTPKEAKRDDRHSSSGRLVSFYYANEEWPLEPKTLFYDYIFVNALIQNFGTDLDLSSYDWFTDIEFNPKKSINCQARSVAVYKLLQKENRFDVLENKQDWKEYHTSYVKG